MPTGKLPRVNKNSNDNWLVLPALLCFIFSSLSLLSSSLLSQSQWHLKDIGLESPSSSSSPPPCYEGSFHRWEDITRLVTNSPKLFRHPLIWIILLRALLSSLRKYFGDFSQMFFINIVKQLEKLLSSYFTSFTRPGLVPSMKKWMAILKLLKWWEWGQEKLAPSCLPQALIRFSTNQHTYWSLSVLLIMNIGRQPLYHPHWISFWSSAMHLLFVWFCCENLLFVWLFVLWKELQSLACLL